MSLETLTDQLCFNTLVDVMVGDIITMSPQEKLNHFYLGHAMTGSGITVTSQHWRRAASVTMNRLQQQSVGPALCWLPFHDHYHCTHCSCPPHTSPSPANTTPSPSRRFTPPIQHCLTLDCLVHPVCEIFSPHLLK